MTDAYDTSKYDPKGTKNLMALDESGEIRNLEALEKILKVFNYVWDTDLLAAVRMQQPATADDINSALGTGAAETRIAYDSNNNTEYVGENDTLGAATSATDWTITKITYTSGLVTRVQVQETSWDDRELGW